jgi:hypothetical protein
MVLEENMNTGRQFLDGVTHYTHELMQSALMLPWPASIVILSIPLLLATISRSTVSIVATALLSVLAGAALALNVEADSSAALALAIYAGAVLAALHGHDEARREREIAAASSELAQLRTEMLTFLDALDRRARAVDKFTHFGSRISKEQIIRPEAPEEARPSA